MNSTTVAWTVVKFIGSIEYMETIFEYFYFRDSLDKLLYSSLPVFINNKIKLFELMIKYHLISMANISDVRDIATHWVPAFNPNNTTLS